MNGKTFNKLIDDFIDTLAPGIAFYAPVLRIELVSDTLKSVPDKKVNNVIMLIKVIEQLNKYERSYTEDLHRNIDIYDHILHNTLLNTSLSLERLDLSISALIKETNRVKDNINNLIRSERVTITPIFLGNKPDFKGSEKDE